MAIRSTNWTHRNANILTPTPFRFLNYDQVGYPPSQSNGDNLPIKRTSINSVNRRGKERWSAFLVSPATGLLSFPPNTVNSLLPRIFRAILLFKSRFNRHHEFSDEQKAKRQKAQYKVEAKPETNAQAL